jgi:hypothetical protein
MCFIVEMLFHNIQKAAVILTVFSQGYSKSAIILLEGNVNLFCDTLHYLQWREKGISLPPICLSSSPTHAPVHHCTGDFVKHSGLVFLKALCSRHNVASGMFQTKYSRV